MGLYPALNTHRNREALLHAATTTTTATISLFQYECLIAGISAFFSRYTIPASTNEPTLQRVFFATILSFLAYNRKPYEIICAFHIFSYVTPILLSYYRAKIAKRQTKETLADKLLALTLVIMGGILSLLFCQSISSGTLPHILSIITPTPFIKTLYYLFPIAELVESYDIVSAFVEPVLLRRMLSQLLFVTFHIQIGIGYLGIDFLKAEQMRKNELIRMEFTQADAEEESNSENDKKKKKKEGTDEKTVSKDENEEIRREKQLKAAHKFRRAAIPFIFFTVLPYMFQIIFFGNMNQFAFFCVRDDIHREIRLNSLFEHDSHLVAMSVDSATSPEQYAQSMDTVVTTSYDIFNRKLFSLPKIMLLPGVIVKQPMLLIKIFPFIFLSDFIKARLVATLTTEVERLEKAAKEVHSIRSKVEAFDMKNAELLQRSGFGSTEFTRKKWEELTEQIQTHKVSSEQLRRTRIFFQWLQNNFIFRALIDCALANLIAMGRIVSSEIFVFSRAIEDTVDLLLMRSRAESELATMKTEIRKLGELNEVWSRSLERNLIHCMLHDDKNATNSAATTTGAGAGQYSSDSVVIHNLQYQRGTAFVSVENMVLTPGVYAITGANGSGKSTLFRVLLSCDTNEKAIDLPESIQLLSPMHHHTLMDEVVPPGSCKIPDEGCDPPPLDDDDDDAAVTKEEDKEEKKKAIVPKEEIPVTSITMPSSDVSEISQTFYWPLYTKPIDWIYQKHLSEEVADDVERESMVRCVAEQLQELAFFQTQESSASDSSNGGDKDGGGGKDKGGGDVGTECKEGEQECKDVMDSEDLNGEKMSLLSSLGDSVDAATAQLMVDLQEEKEDWFSDLSGGQKSKVELVRKVFLHEKCPDVLLIDETMAPLDPTSKSLVMSKVKGFRKDSVVLVIYHTDVGRGENGDADGDGIDDGDDDDFVECVPSNNFFDHNLHVENKVLVRRPVC